MLVLYFHYQLAQKKTHKLHQKHFIPPYSHNLLYALVYCELAR